ncbi:NPCBM/NEW2 domain-containing protein [Streptomyces sp. NPDC006458]|uniref:NPCBM/NEW2 domain-containing protein n=1 Tax=Streptomyces sp. NPDC006458 TaxID=3154302 RepID=UPI0033BB7F96
MRSLPPNHSRRVAAGLACVVLAGAVYTAPASLAAPAQAPPYGGVGAAVERDGLALTPPMGFNNWNSTHCRADFNEAMVKGIADIFVAKGLKEVGYEYVNLDDCWALPQRDAQGKLVPDPQRFPSGIKAVADYVHSKGLKFGIYTSAGTKTCDRIGFPGGLGHEYSDARQFADWGVDYLKYDNCSNQGVDARQRYTTMRDALRATGRPMVFSICEWGESKPWEWASDVGHLWRTTGDINDSWGSTLAIMKKNLPLHAYAKPGNWNDPDMLEVGNGGMTGTEYRTQFSLWSIMAAPLLIGSDLRKADEKAFEILGNREVVAVDQDPLGRQGKVISSDGGRWVVAKEMTEGSRAVALFNESDRPQRIATTALDVGLPQSAGYRMRDLWRHTDTSVAGTVAATVPAHGTVLVRLWADRHWKSYPPALEAGQSSAWFTQAGVPAEVSTTVTNLGRKKAKSLSVDLTGPAGWAVTPTSPTESGALRAGKTLTTTWSVKAPPSTRPGTYDVTLSAAYEGPKGVTRVYDQPLAVSVVVLPPDGTSYLSDTPWLSVSNGWGPVEKDRSVGESALGDGGPITIGGTRYTKGLGAHAPSVVEYYLGGECSSFKAMVGLDDETGTRGTAAFEVWVDGRKVTATEILTNATPAQRLSAAVAGAETMRLVVTDGGDGISYDHADWADATLTC